MDKRLNSKQIKNLINLDKKNIWHPFTQMADWVKDVPSQPLIIERAKGSYLYDANGKKYIDGVSSLWLTLFGHRNKKIDSAVKAQLAKVAHSTFLGLTHVPAIELSQKLLNVLPKNFTKVFYSDNGSTSVEVALKMAYQYAKTQNPKTKKQSFLSLKNAYHGDTVGSVSVGGMGIFHSIFKKMLFKNFFAPSPYCYRCPHRNSKGIMPFYNKAKGFKEHCKTTGCAGQCLREVEVILKKHHNEIAAAIIEPLVQGAAGMITMPKGYLSAFAAMCKKYNVLLICDEVATGFGHTGKMFAIEHEQIKPDFICLSKGITGGYLPLAATITTEKIYKSFLGKYEDFKTFFHGHSYTANPLACAAANATLDIFKDEKIIDRNAEKLKYFTALLNKLSRHKNVGQIRQCGFMVGIEIVKNSNTGESFDFKLKTGAKICAALRKRGIILRPLGDTIIILPHLTISKTDIAHIVNSIETELNAL
ncbi:MAG: adenosylmethionine--8-amino-7-oxononanoate transaminase [Elusimicrobia bacterium]|nr:adenosylmethionine--8-amino-7-oxononanoate transaminase [Elusimicrobiota bacterium]